jgi:SAM-dependent methyltransferase
VRAPRALRRFRRGESRLPYNLDDAGSPRWEERAEAAVALLAANFDAIAPAGSASLQIADLGAGDERLRRALAAGFGRDHMYTAFDIRPQRDTVVELDVREALPPHAFDVVCCLGLLEYVEPLDVFLRRLAERYPSAVLSYTVVDAPQPLNRRDRRKRGWLSDHTTADVERELTAAGFVVVDFVMSNERRTGIWLVCSRHPQPSPASSSRSDAASSG